MSLPQISSLETAKGTSLSTKSSIASNSTTSSSSSSTSSTSSTSSDSNSAAGLQSEFLNLMVAQVQNQDPLNPLDGTQYVSQLAQFSMVEGIENLRVLQQQSLSMDTTSQILQSTALVGKEVSAPTTSLTLTEEQNVSGQVELTSAADAVALKVYNSSGKLVATKSWSGSDAGTLDYDLGSLPAGTYSFVTTATADGSATQPQNYVNAEVDRVSLPSSGEIQLEVNGVGSVALANIIGFGQS
jgi:Flagellar hook capping protein